MEFMEFESSFEHHKSRTPDQYGAELSLAELQGVQNVTLLEHFVKGSCRQIQCNSCEGVFAGNASRVRNHYTKCLSCPENLRKWAQEQEKLKQEIHSTKVEAKLFTAMIAQDGKVLQQQRIDKLFSAMIAQDDPSARISPPSMGH